MRRGPPRTKQSRSSAASDVYKRQGGDVSEKLFETGTCLPSDTKMTDNDIKRISGIIKGLWK